MSYPQIGFTEKNGLVFCQNLDQAKNNFELIYLTEVQKLQASAVFFRRFYKNSEIYPYHSEPSVVIFQRPNLFFNSEEHIKLHAALWSAGRNEIYIIQSESRIDIINARKPAELTRENDLILDNLILTSSSALESFNDQRFSAYLFRSGTFWEQVDFYNKGRDEKFFKNKLEEENMPYHQLLTFLIQTRLQLQKYNLINFDSEIIDKLIILCILIKFLEEIKNTDGTHTLSKIYQAYSVNTFAEALLQKGTSIDILEELGKKLNGKIFNYFTNKEEAESEELFVERNNSIKAYLRKGDLSPIANLLLVRVNTKTGELDFDLQNRQFKLDFDFSWQQYSFRHLPIELISSIYEHFLQADSREQTGNIEKGVVYTPPFLVNFLIDEVMPLNSPELLQNNAFKVLDPSCGSGVFLVAAYKRLLQWWIINYYKKNGKFPDNYEPKIFQEIFEKNIFGVDVNKKATLITVFSLTIAFLDKLEPIAFWQNLNFKKLQDNIQTKNFFEWAATAKKDFALVIGNPPFNVESDKKKEDVLNKDLLNVINLRHKNIPKNNFALHFFEASMTLTQKVCLIIPSNVLLYYRPSQKYRKDIFTDYNINRIFDFTHLREILFTKKKQTGAEKTKKIGRTPVLALIAENKPSEKKSIEHIVVKRLNTTEKKIRFEIDYYERHIVRWDWALDETKQFIWKTNLLGGGRLFNLVYRLSLLPTLKDFLETKKNENPEWIYSSGYKIGGKGTTKEPADFKRHQRNLPPSSLTLSSPQCLPTPHRIPCATGCSFATIIPARRLRGKYHF